ncbi:hypothetical protein B5K08_24235 [Rhizobium leguminosarum bv. trifolii]|uniref:Lysine-specific metallo-endopeptidase domain-containing protein n=1 Tax=Rhizobium leguminosarum bv. trifolii TaxID=386 RepID=A0A3E1B873_RHILT|nr:MULTISPECIES: M35 family metallo-endopeptidase [Rhizobium]OWV85972.1 hypothetical protein ATY75_23530 [Rhizobium sp. N122]RFB86410.1 hypothetical protein B5K08_24235 [Rhizobium leguminosarum bv. trifolii]RFB86669.1 hypothetical protein B5K10_24225 [Rhizobium leguminosarum bv. trifolii]
MKRITTTVVALLVTLAPASGFAAPVTCTGSPAAMIDAAKSEMQSGLDRAITAIKDHDQKTVDLLTRWLGVRNSDQEQRVLGVLRAARGLSDSLTFVCDMANDEGTFEKIVAQADNGHELLFTARYFGYPETGLVSRPTILFHEVTHIPSVADTNGNDNPKEVYSKDEVLKLANDKPADALRNASNYHYFLGAFLYGE